MATSTEATSPSQINESSEQIQAETPESSASTSQAAAAQGATGKVQALFIIGILNSTYT